MSKTATRTARKTTKPTRRRLHIDLPAPIGRDISEDVSSEKAPLKVDREKGIIFGVKVLGRFSKNTHDEDVSGTEYSPEAMKKAVELYEGITVRINHPEDRKNPGAPRDVYDSFGQLRNVRFEGECLRADLHYLKSHDLAEAVVEDVERGLGVYGLSHNARACRERVEGGRLIIEEIELVRSVDLVDKPATNRNLWESHTMAKKKTTLRQLLEAATPKLTKNRKAWAKRLIDLFEDDGAPMDAPVEAEPDADEAMSNAFGASCYAIIDKILNGELDVKEGLTKLKDLITTHDKLMGETDPGEVPEEEEEEKPTEVAEEEEEKKTEVTEEEDKDKMEALQERLDKMERREKARELCESLEFIPSKDQLDDLVSITSPAAQKRVAEAYKAATGKETPAKGGKTPRSVAPGRNLRESQNGDNKPKIPETAAGEMSFLRRG